MLPRLRPTLDLMPSPIEEHPGLLIRDPLQYTDATIVIPPQLVECLTFFDGEQSSLDLRAYLVRLTGDVQAGDLEKHLVETLSAAGFLDDEAFAERRAAVERAFAEAPARYAVHAGSGYPEEPAELTAVFTEYMNGGGSSKAMSGVTRAIAAPHVSPFGGIEAYRAAYAALSPADAERTFVVLGTSHYGMPNRFGLTHKPFATPFGETTPVPALVEEIARGAGEAIVTEDYCHSIEHSIEFQVVFLQHLFGPRIKVVPVLCGPFTSVYTGGLPEDDDAVRRMIGTLGEIAAREGDNLLWVLGVDMAHMGERYGDRFEARAQQGQMLEVANCDFKRIASMERGDAQGFWEQIREKQDDLKWCGSAPIYTFLRAMPQARGELLHYQQWNIDPASVVSFAGMRFASKV